MKKNKKNVLFSTKALNELRRQVSLIVVVLMLTTLQSYADSTMQSTKMTIRMNNEPLISLFAEIENNSDFHFLYDENEMDVSQKITLFVKNSTVESILDIAFKNSEIKYETADRYIILSKKKNKVNESETVLQQQQKTVTGTVTDQNGDPLPGVSIVIKGTTIGTASDVNGNFTLEGVPNNATLQFIFLGMITQDVYVGNKTNISVKMQEESIGLDEVVAVGYGTMRKRDVVGAISSVNTDDISMGSSSSIGHVLMGKAAGLMIKQNSAQPGGGLDILIRGGASINASNAPLIVVDGFPISELNQPASGGRYQAGTQSVLNSFNPNDIESIEVLKDASATAIYGSRAANGVILITSKRGKIGKPIVQYSTDFSFQQYNNEFDVLPLNEWMQVRNEAAKEDFMYVNKVFPYGTKTLEEAMENPLGGPLRKLYTQNAIDNVGRGTDWLDLVTRNGSVMQHNVSVSGGTDVSKYLISGNYYDHKGIIENSRIRRYSFRTNIDQKLSNYVNMGLNMTASRIDNDNSQLGGDQFENSGIIRAALQQGPHIQAIDENGNYPLNPQLSIQPNPYSLLTITDKGQVERMLANTFLEIKPIEDLTIKLNAGFERGITKRSNYLPQTTVHGALEKGKATISQNDRNDYLVEATVNYAKTFAVDHKFNVLVGLNRQESDMNGTE